MDKIQISRVDESGFYLEPVLVTQQEIDRHLNVEDEFTLGNVVIDDVQEGLHSPKWDSVGLAWVEGKSDVDLLELKRQHKISELYGAYQTQKLGGVTSSLVGADSKTIVFAYAEHNQNDYRSIGVKFALNTTLIESIIGSQSHGKFFITREDYTKLVGDFDAHETNLYVKFKDLKTKAESAASESDLDLITWN